MYVVVGVELEPALKLISTLYSAAGVGVQLILLRSLDIEPTASIILITAQHS